MVTNLKYLTWKEICNNLCILISRWIRTWMLSVLWESVLWVLRLLCKSELTVPRFLYESELWLEAGIPTQTWKQTSATGMKIDFLIQTCKQAFRQGRKSRLSEADMEKSFSTWTCKQAFRHWHGNMLSNTGAYMLSNTDTETGFLTLAWKWAFWHGHRNSFPK